METVNNQEEMFTEEQSLQVIRDMIQVSQRKLKSDGILFMVWGYAMFINYFSSYLKEILFLPRNVHAFINLLGVLLPLLALAYTVYYTLKQNKKVRTYVGISLRYIWISLFVCMVTVNLILANVTHEVNFTLQHPLFMVLIALALSATGIILQFRIIVIGAVIYLLLAYLCSYLALRDQMLIDAIAWFVALVVPGHILYFKRNS